MLFKNIIYWYIHRFTISIREIVLQFNEKGKGAEELEQLKSLSLKIQKLTSKRSVAISEKKEKNTSDKPYIYLPGAFTYKRYPCY